MAVLSPKFDHNFCGFYEPGGSYDFVRKVEFGLTDNLTYRQHHYAPLSQTERRYRIKKSTRLSVAAPAGIVRMDDIH